ncbi:MAG: GDP-mannose 4,6-dehydratase [Verrucomicrobiota bacterium]
MSESTFWQGKRVAVTGATGMVGAWLVKDLLEQGASVIALVRDADPQSEFFRSGDYQKTTVVSGELENFNAVERMVNEHEADTIFHLAAQPIVGAALRAPLPTFEANIRGTYHVLEAARLHSLLVKRVVIASSDKAYGTSKKLPYLEDMPLRGEFPYEVSKSCADLITHSYFHTYGTPITVARCGNIFGGGDLNWSRIVPDTIRRLLNGQPPELRSDGTFVRDYLYVKDVTRAYMVLAENMGKEGVDGEAFNFSPEVPMTVLEIVEAIQKVMGKTDLEPVILNRAKNEILSQYLDSSKAKERLGWTCQYSLEAGLKDTVDWYQEFLKR